MARNFISGGLIGGFLLRPLGALVGADAGGGLEMGLFSSAKKEEPATEPINFEPEVEIDEDSYSKTFWDNTVTLMTLILMTTLKRLSR